MPLTLRVPIVGTQFRPPAAQLIRVLPINQPLYIESEPSNEHDPDALRVMLPLDTLDIENNEQIASILQSTHLTAQKSLEDFINNNSIHLGYVARSSNPRSCQIDNKPSPGNTEILNALLQSKIAGITVLTIWRYNCKLTFSLSGQPLIEVSIP